MLLFSHQDEVKRTSTTGALSKRVGRFPLYPGGYCSYFLVWRRRQQNDSHPSTPSATRIYGECSAKMRYESGKIPLPIPLFRRAIPPNHRHAWFFSLYPCLYTNTAQRADAGAKTKRNGASTGATSTRTTWGLGKFASVRGLSAYFCRDEECHT